MFIFAALARRSASQDESSVGDAAVLFFKRRKTHEMHARVVVGEVIGHRFYLFFYTRFIGAILGHDVALAQVFFARAKFRVFARANPL